MLDPASALRMLLPGGGGGGPSANQVQPGPSGFVHTDAGGPRCGTCQYLRGNLCTNGTLNADSARYHFAPQAQGGTQVDPRNDCCNEWEHAAAAAGGALGGY